MEAEIGTRIELTPTVPGSRGFRMDDWPVAVWSSSALFEIGALRRGSPPEIPAWWVAYLVLAGECQRCMTPIGVDVESEGIDWHVVDQPIGSTKGQEVSDGN